MHERPHSRSIAALLLGWLLASGAPAEDYKAGSLVVGEPWSRATAPGAPVGAVYFFLTNSGGSADRLLSIDTPIASEVQIHETRKLQGSMQMRELGSLDCPPGVTLKVEPGALHVMLLGLHQPLAAGTSFPLTLHFRNAGELTVRVAVRSTQ